MHHGASTPELPHRSSRGLIAFLRTRFLLFFICRDPIAFYFVYRDLIMFLFCM
jgi:hypothetical protein